MTTFAFRSAILLALITLATLGCKPIRRELASTTTSETTFDNETRVLDPPHIDDAQLILAGCGRPASDTVLPIYNKLNNGPVRRMVYNGTRSVTFDFTPSNPIVKPANGFARHQELPRTLPPNSVWRFDEARMGHETMLTSNRIHYYVPCAANALSKEY